MEDFTSLADLYSPNDSYILVPEKTPVSVPPDLFASRMVLPKPEQFPSLSDVGSALAAPFQAAGKAVSGGVDYVTGTVRNAYLYLIGGIVVIGILSIFVLGAGTKFAGKVGYLK